jgi:tRNA threonylcarbamoyladenosine biosynthesis protein TsaB
VSLLTLGVESSGLAGSVALRRGGETVAVASLEQAGRRHAQTLVSEIDALLCEHGLTAKQLELIAVSIGPGSFTGLRVGVVFAKTMAYATGCRLAAVDTFRTIAAASPADVADLFVVADAQRGELFVGRYAREEKQDGGGPAIRWNPRKVISIAATDVWCRQLAELAPSSSAVSGPAVEAIRSSLPSFVRVLDSELRLPRADRVAELGEQQALAGELADVWTLEPFYLRRSAAEEKSCVS